MRLRPMSLRAFDADDLMIDADLVDGREMESVVERFFDDPRVAYIHAHYAKRGCYAARIERCLTVRTSALYTPSLGQIDRLVAAYPLATLISSANHALSATPLPLMLERDARGAATLVGHFARSNPHLQVVERWPEALAVFMGPHGYISPSWFADRTQAPTWNFATVHMKVHVQLDHSLEAARRAVELLTEKMESGRPNAWAPSDMGERYHRLLPGIVAFRASILGVAAKFKLGQNERLDVLEETLAGLAQEAAPELHAMMRLANAERLGQLPS